MQIGLIHVDNVCTSDTEGVCALIMMEVRRRCRLIIWLNKVDTGKHGRENLKLLLCFHVLYLFKGKMGVISLKQHFLSLLLDTVSADELFSRVRSTGAFHCHQHFSTSTEITLCDSKFAKFSAIFLS